MKSAVIVIPTYNEAENIVEVVETVLRTTQSIRNWSFRLLIVDSSSPDKTGEIVKNLAKKNSKISVISTEKEGLGKAYVDGFSYALEHYSPEVLFEMDADMSHDPRAVKLFINSIDDGADFVIGTRYSRGGSIPKDWGIDRKFFSIFGNIIIRLGFMKPSITDWTSGFRAIKASIIKENIEYIKKYTGYVFQVAILDRAIKQHADIY
jgi:dolichol-phosphate mannosyltransferase